MRLKWSEPELKSKWNFEQFADAPEGYYDEPRRDNYGRNAPRGCCGCGNTNYQPDYQPEGNMRPRYVKPKYELGTDEGSQLRMIWG